MSVCPGKEVRLIEKETGKEIVAEVAQVIYGETILGVACITKNGIEDFYFTEWMIKPFNYHNPRKERANESGH